MLLSRLHEHSFRLEREQSNDFAPTGYGRERVRWLIELNADGRWLGITAQIGTGKNAELGREQDVPALSKMRGIKLTSKLLADNGQYVLGLSAEGKKADRAAESHRLFRDLVARCAEATNEPTVKAVQRFLADLDISTLQLEGVEAAHNMTFSVDGVLPINLPAVKLWWADCRAAESESRAGVCCVTNRAGPVIERLPQPIKRIPGGQVTGLPLISMNADAFESYGLQASYNAQISLDAAERVGKTLNWLLASERHRITIGPLAYVFWTREESGTDYMALFTRPDEASVHALYKSASSGRQVRVLDADAFYAVGLSASGSRVVVRDWIDTTIPVAQQHLARWFKAQELVDPYGAPGQPLGIYALATSLYRNGEPKELVANVPQALFRVALHGGAVPDFLAAQALRRNIAEGGFGDRKPHVAIARARLLKAWLYTQPEFRETITTQEDYMSQLEPVAGIPAPDLPAYSCGRLLAVLEATQRAALGKTNTTLVDRFYGTASTAPASVFGTLLKESQAHLSKLRKNREATYNALSQRMEEILLPLQSGFPRTLTLKQQALFSLGYYHQRAADRAQARARAELRDLAPDVSDTTQEDQ